MISAIWVYAFSVESMNIQEDNGWQRHRLRWPDPRLMKGRLPITQKSLLGGRVIGSSRVNHPCTTRVIGKPMWVIRVIRVIIRVHVHVQLRLPEF